MRSQIWELCYSVCWSSGFKSVCQRDPRSNAGKEGREGRGTGLDLIDNTWQKDTVSPWRGQGTCILSVRSWGTKKARRKSDRQRIFQLDIRKTFLTKSSKLQVAKSAVELERAQEWQLTESPTSMVSLLLAPDPTCCGSQLAVTVYSTLLWPTAPMPTQRDCLKKSANYWSTRDLLE